MHIIKFCIGLHCRRKGYSELLEEFERVLGIKAGEVTSDRNFRLELSGCIGSCRQALAVSIDGNIYRHLEVEDVEKLIDSYKIVD